MCLAALDFCFRPNDVPGVASRLLMEFAYLIHDVTFILFAMLIVFHIYLGTAAEPRTFA